MRGLKAIKLLGAIVSEEPDLLEGGAISLRVSDSSHSLLLTVSMSVGQTRADQLGVAETDTR